MGIISSIVLTIALVLNSYVESLNKTIESLQRCKDTTMKLPSLIKRLDTTRARILKILPPKVTETSPEELIYAKVEEIKGSFKDSTVAIKEMGVKDDSVVLPLTIQTTITNERQYNELIRGLYELQAYAFPFFIFEGLSFNISDKADTVKVEVSGRLESPKKGHQGT